MDNTREAFSELAAKFSKMSIPECFERCVVSNARRPAVQTEVGAISYDEVNRLSNRIAQAVVGRLSAMEQPVALLVEQGPHAIAAILGALKAGAVYVPLDPAFPHARNSLILADSEADLIITNDRNRASARSLRRESSMVNIDRLDIGLDDRNVGLSIPPDRQAYILYTSGSTGQPKGVVHTHRTALRAILRYMAGLCLSPEDRLSLFPSYSVTASVSNIFGGLLTGACLFPFNVKENGVADLAPWLVRNEITVYRSVPTVYRHFIGTLKRHERFPQLRLVRLGGEPATRRDLEAYRKHFADHCAFINGYGTSEASNVWQYRVEKSTPVSQDLVPVGYPIDDTQFSLVDEAGEEVRLGAMGEIAIKSRDLSPGYWRRAELTQRVFRTDSDNPDVRIYYTGDIGYCLPDGCLVHMGRKDSQVKIRGYRIELEEIQLALLDAPEIKEAVVVAQDDGAGEKQLVAYLVFQRERSLDTKQLREHLAEKVPDYMLPAAFVRLDALPLTPNGKLDRRALPTPDHLSLERAEDIAAPRTPVEEVVAGLWAEVLGLQQVGIHDNFFELGGNSLLATRLTSRLRDLFQVELSLRNILEAPTVAELALVLLQDPVRGAKVGELARLLLDLVSRTEVEAEELLASEPKAQQ